MFGRSSPILRSPSSRSLCVQKKLSHSIPTSTSHRTLHYPASNAGGDALFFRAKIGAFFLKLLHTFFKLAEHTLVNSQLVQERVTIEPACAKYRAELLHDCQSRKKCNLYRKKVPSNRRKGNQRNQEARKVGISSISFHIVGAF